MKIPRKLVLVITIFLLLGLIVYYKPLSENFNFALDMGTTVNKKDLDPTKYYLIGKRNTSNTTTPSRNGGTDCEEFPEIAYKLAPPTNAVCKDNIMNDYYTWVDTQVSGKDILSQ